MIPEDLIATFRADRDRYRESAIRALRDLIRNAEETLARVDTDLMEPTVRQSVGGSVLNEQRWQDAERNLVRFWDAAGVVANLERENATFAAVGSEALDSGRKILGDEEADRRADPAVVAAATLSQNALVEAARETRALNEASIFDAQARWILDAFGQEAADKANYGWGIDEVEGIIATKVYGEPGGVLTTDVRTGEHRFEPFDEVPLIPPSRRFGGIGPEDRSPTLEERLTDDSFVDREPGTVSEDEYQSRLSEVQETAAYLRNEDVWRVEYNQAWGQTPRVSYYEATSEDEARSRSLPVVRGPYGVGEVQIRIVSCRRATVEDDLEEYVSELARELGWDR